MIAASIHPGEKSWSKRRWFSGIAVLFILHLVLVLIFSRQRPAATVETREKTSYHLMVAPVSERALDLLLANDPTLFVLPNEHGFSGAAWMNSQKTFYEPPDWNEAPRWLKPDPRKLGETFVKQLQLNRPVSVQIVDKLPAPKDIVPVLTRISDSRPPLQLEGEIASRVQFPLPEIPVWTNTEPFADTVLQIAVNGSGDVVSARIGDLGFSPTAPLISGLPAADEAALALARTLRFEPRNSTTNGSDLSWGKLIFHWRIVPPPTNPANGNPIEIR